MMQTVLKKELIIDKSHSFLLSDLPSSNQQLPANEKLHPFESVICQNQKKCHQEYEEQLEWEPGAVVGVLPQVLAVEL